VVLPVRQGSSVASVSRKNCRRHDHSTVFELALFAIAGHAFENSDDQVVDRESVSHSHPVHEHRLVIYQRPGPLCRARYAVSRYLWLQQSCPYMSVCVRSIVKSGLKAAGQW